MYIALIIILLILLFWPYIMKWVGRFMARRAEDYLRRATGMPPRPGSRAARKEESRRKADRQDGRRSYRSYRSGGSRGYERDSDGPIIPREYAEDVEFVETKDYSESTISDDRDGIRKETRYRESQVSDVEWEEIKTKPRRKN